MQYITIHAIPCNMTKQHFFHFSFFSLHMTSSLSLTYILHFIRHSRRTSLPTSVTEKYAMLFRSHKCFWAWNQDFMNIACLQIKVLNVLWVENLSLGRWSLRFCKYIFFWNPSSCKYGLVLCQLKRWLRKSFWTCLTLESKFLI